MRFKFLLSTFILILGFARISIALNPTAKNADVTSVKNDLNWYDVQKQSSPILQGVAWNEELKGTFGRLPLRAKATVRPDVWGLSENCAGITIRFKTNASEIKVVYQVSGPQGFPHMPNTGISGLDLYTTDSQGKAIWSAGAYSFGDTINYTFKNLNTFASVPTNREYQLFLPLYAHVKWMEIGLPKESELTWITPSTDKPLVVYGTSIAQGGCASRPGMAWTGILNRELPYPLINLAFSGNGLLEKEVLEFINEIDAQIYILDCLPNLVSRSAEEIEKATLEAVKQIRMLHKTPILLVEHPGYNDGFVDKTKFDSYNRANNASKAAYKKLKADGIDDLFYLSYEEINMPMDGTVDGIHSTDYGMRSYADAYEKKIQKILHIPTKLKK
jgi:lysophospholipase L1-like esterase